MSDALEGAAGKDPAQSSPMSDRKKNRRKKSMNQKGDAAVGQAEGDSTQRWRCHELNMFFKEEQHLILILNNWKLSQMVFKYLHIPVQFPLSLCLFSEETD